MKKVAPAKPARNTLNPERVLQTACTLVDTHGAAALTMRRLGAELGVVPMAVYNHFPDRDAILDAIAEHSLGKIAARVRSGGWRTRLDAMIGDLRDLAVGHPHVYDISLSRPNKPAAAMMLMFEALDASTPNEEMLAYWLVLEREDNADLERDYEAAWKRWAPSARRR